MIEIKKNTTITEGITDPLNELLKAGAQKLVQAAVEAELSQALAQYKTVARLDLI